MIIPCYFCDGLLNTDDLGFCPHCGGSIQKAIEQARERHWESSKTPYFTGGPNCYFVDGGRRPTQYNEDAAAEVFMSNLRNYWGK